MEFTPEQRSAAVLAVKGLRKAIKGQEAANADVAAKLATLKTCIGTSSGNAEGVMNDALKLLGEEYLKTLDA